jgi:membrane protease YdiL (CAAX protease family)
MNKKRLYSILFLISLILLFQSIPFSLFITEKIVLFIINIIIKIGSIIYFFYYLKKEKLNPLKREKIKFSSVKLIPLLLLCFSNIFVVIIAQSNLKENINIFEIITGFFIAIGVGIIEELLFRSQLLQEFLNNKNKLTSLLYSSLIFGSVHLLNISSFSSIPNVLVQVVYTFFLGLILGIIYIHSENIILPIIFHILFNFINDTLVSNLFYYKWDLTFFIVNILVALLVSLYIFIISIKRKVEKRDNYAS